MIIYSTAESIEDFQGILNLQKLNLAQNLSSDEIAVQGFVTVVHSLAVLQQMSSVEKHIIAKDGNKVVAYLLAMTSASKYDSPVLEPMFNTFNEISFNEQPVSNYSYIVVGQVCVAKAYRGQGILDCCYSMYRRTYKHKYNFAITEIAATNLRSLQAHKRIGFFELHYYHAPDGQAWKIVLWDWQNGTIN